jgi:uncharacterized protein (DUF1800 family)
MDVHDQPTVAGSGDDEVTEKNLPTLPEPASAQNEGASPRAKGMSRRKLFGLAALGAVGVGGIAAAGSFALEKMSESTPGAVSNAEQIGHLLRRAGFGASRTELATYASYGFSGAVDHLLNYEQVSDDAMEQRLKALNLDLNKPQDQQRWWLLRMAWTQRPLLEKMTLFWHGVLTSSIRKVGGKDAYMRMIVQNQFLRAHAFDTFDNILLGITGDPAMLFYLDLTKSRKNAPNENYARELMELFTIGLGNYTQQDVHEGALALTGWHVQGKTSQARYSAHDHNTQSKTFLGQTGNLDYKDVVRILANHKAAPWFISRKLFTFFVYENPSTADLQPLVDTYEKSGHSMREVMRTLLLSPQFSSAKAYRSRLKSPVEFTVGALRSLDVQYSGTGLPAVTTAMGQTLFAVPNVAGWPGDKVSALWLNSGTWMARLNYIDTLLAGSKNAAAKNATGKKATTTKNAQNGQNNQTGQNNQYSPLDLQGIINTNHIDTPEHFVDYFASFLLDGKLDAERRTQLLTYFNSKDSTAAQAQQITLSGGKQYPLSRVRGTLYLLMASPEYQLN